MPKSKHAQTGLIIAFLTCFAWQSIFAAEQKTHLKKIEFNQKNNLEISLSKKTDFKIFTLENPQRLVIDLTNCDFEKPGYTPRNPSFVASFHATKNEKNLRLVFNLNQKINIQKTRFEKVRKQNSGKITAEIKTSGKPTATKQREESTVNNDFISAKVEEFDVQTRKVQNPDGSAKYVVTKIPKNSSAKNPQTKVATANKIPVIVIDSGHGGKDPGTIGSFARTKEKNVTLSYARELGKHLINTKRYKVYLTRDNDTFIPLRERVQRARRRKADLFISLHANATSDKSTSGFSIYTLSETSSDKQAELLAEKENRADIISGVDFEGASKDIMKTLIDLSQRESKNSSARFANLAIKSVQKSGVEALQNTHRFAGFAVLTAPDMASVLIELGYLSNKNEERLLNSISYKRKIAENLVKAVDEFFRKTE